MLVIMMVLCLLDTANAFLVPNSYSSTENHRYKTATSSSTFMSSSFLADSQHNLLPTDNNILHMNTCTGIQNEKDISNKSRRSFLTSASLSILATTTFLPSSAVAEPLGEKVTPQFTFEQSEEKLRQSYQTVLYLLSNYNDVCAGGGDNVRRYLGTIVSTPPSPLVGMAKTLKGLESKADDFVEFTELSEEIIKSINQADGSAYMAIFVSTSSSSTPPEKYFSDAKIEIQRCKRSIEQMAEMVNIKL